MFSIWQHSQVHIAWKFIVKIFDISWEEKFVSRRVDYHFRHAQIFAIANWVNMDTHFVKLGSIEIFCEL